MSDTTLRLPRPSLYPERRVPRETPMDFRARSLLSLAAPLGGSRTRALRRIVRLTNAAALPPTVTDDALRTRAADLSLRLRAGPWPPAPALVAESFALVREASARVTGMRHFDVQVMGAAALVRGMVAEMQTGEGKTLTATLAAITAGLAGVPVHLVTSNDYLAARDAEEMGPLYRFFGLTVGAVVEGVKPEERRRAYAADITYCCNKEAAFDYLKDRIHLRERADNLHLRVESLVTDRPRLPLLLHRGLPFAIVDEADSVLIDEARIPLIISRSVPPSPEAEETYRRALHLAQGMQEGRHFKHQKALNRVDLTEDGRSDLAEAVRDWDGSWRVPVIREDLVRKALTALLTLHRGEDYLVREDKIEIVDEYTGRRMPDRSWSEGLHQFVELKEGVPLSSARETLARMTYQRFFRRYRWLSGMTGTARSVTAELQATYGLKVATIPTNRTPQRRIRPARIFADAAARWQAVAQRAAEIHATGAPILIGTRSVEASERAADAMRALGLGFTVLNAEQDAEEASIIARAGQMGAITVATNMAGRGTDIKLGEGVAAMGGLHVLMTERHDSARIDRQLAGRCARQGQPGQVETLLSMQDDLLTQLSTWSPAKLARLGGRARFFDAAQRAIERRHAAMRRELMRVDSQMGDMLAFTGTQE
ncbi:preprotein translocase subunit SecA [Thetidibacter halocola]|uniref:Protein translocase subunit SecA n=1 Tax=Thetidibacter halocola TaxID=2827239 RepID=A0A8J8BC23_9RHOB|nr:preprotein translocase subunit SecA [Thetidibacter halocola]MBS0126828.1 preprotein translocase subunit SecA [Thetidibacter halocola]